MAEGNGDVKTRQRNAPHYLINMGKLGFFGAHKLAPRGRVVKQIQHFKRGALWMCSGFNRHGHIAPFGIGLPGFALIGSTGSQRQTGNRADTGQRFSTESQADNGFQIVKAGDFTGGMASQRHRQLALRNARAVVTNANKFSAALLDIDIDPRSTGIKAIFDQLFYNRCRPLHHFASGDLVSQLWRKNLNRHGNNP